MNRHAFDKFYTGFLFVLIDFRIQGFDVLPDIIGYIFLAVGLSALAAYGNNFKTASFFNIPMMIISLFSIYEKPAQQSGINFGFMGIWGIPVAVAGFVLNLLVVYYLFKGIKDMARDRGIFQIMDEADQRWKQFLLLQFAAIFGIILFVLPVLAIVYIVGMLIFSIWLTVAVMKFMKACGEYL